MIVALVATSRLVHVSIATSMMGMMFPVYALPVVSLAFVVWAVASRGLSDGSRRAAMVSTILLACGGWTLVRTGGFTGNLDHDFAWRWAETPEERLMAHGGDEPLDAGRRGPAAPVAGEASKEPPVGEAGEKPAVLAAAPAVAKPMADWPGFRGRDRDGLVRGVRINTDWSTSPPVEMWRRPIGPGWSSFAVSGDLLYTQEQRGEDEVVTAYTLTTGEPVWRHRTAARFWEANAGPGPRGTPTLSNGRVYTLGGTGILNALDARHGALVWSRNAAADTSTKVPDWGFASSPLVIDDLVIVAVSGALVAYDRATGEPRWFGPVGGEGYSSPQLLTIDGVAQVVLISGAGAIGVTPAAGVVLWENPWSGYPIVQPALTAEGDVLFSVNAGGGTRRIAVAHGPGGWTVDERWTSIGLKPYFNDFVVHEGHAFGFDGSILACIDLTDGKRKWKGGHYGNGQLVLLPDQDVLLVLSEEGELALVKATPDQFTEVARFPALDGKTWNHPVLVGDVLLVRNGQEMAAFQLSLAGH
jgi:outer membrane protein assembly factor BamB